MSIYERAVRALQADGVVNKTSRVLVACGGDTDALVLRKCSFADVLITNLDDNCSPRLGDYGWQRCDAESLPFQDTSFDFGVIHNGLHHCRSPHLGLIELMRVARNVLVIEARDSVLMRLAVRLGLTSEYEIESVALYEGPNGEKGKGGGVRNTGVPNFIYRWTEREVRKTAESAYPEKVHDIRFFYGLTLPEERMTMAPPVRRALYRVASVGARAAFELFPRQGNRFAFAVIDTGRRKPWIVCEQGRPIYDMGYDPGFDADKYVKEDVARRP
jgi:hypothetical protein